MQVSAAHTPCLQDILSPLILPGEPTGGFHLVIPQPVQPLGKGNPRPAAHRDRDTTTWEPSSVQERAKLAILHFCLSSVSSLRLLQTSTSSQSYLHWRHFILIFLPLFWLWLAAQPALLLFLVEVPQLLPLDTHLDLGLHFDFY